QWWRAGGDTAPFGSATGTSVIGSENAGLAAGTVAIILIGLLEIPTSDLNVTLGVAQEGFRVHRRALFHGRPAALSGPFARYDRRHLHQADLSVATFLPGTEVGLFIDNAPNQIGIDMMQGG